MIGSIISSILGSESTCTNCYISSTFTDTSDMCKNCIKEAAKEKSGKLEDEVYCDYPYVSAAVRSVFYDSDSES